MCVPTGMWRMHIVRVACHAPRPEILYFLQRFYQKFPEFVDSRDFEPFGRRVNTPQRRAERYHVEFGILLKEQSALQSRVNRAYFGLNAE